MAQGKAWIVVGLVACLGSTAWLARAEAPPAGEAPQVGRYQLISGRELMVFDTATGRLFVQSGEGVTTLDYVTGRKTWRRLQAEEAPPPATPPAPALDLSSREKAAAALIDALLRGDAATVRRCVTPRILAKLDAAGKFEEFLSVWKGELEAKPDLQNPAVFAQKARMAQDGPDWKLDEN